MSNRGHDWYLALVDVDQEHPEVKHLQLPERAVCLAASVRGKAPVPVLVRDGQHPLGSRIVWVSAKSLTRVDVPAFHSAPVAGQWRLIPVGEMLLLQSTTSEALCFALHNSQLKTLGHAMAQEWDRATLCSEHDRAVHALAAFEVARADMSESTAASVGETLRRWVASTAPNEEADEC